MAECSESSGLSRSEFAGRQRTSLSSPERWLSEARKAPKDIPEVLFREALKHANHRPNIQGQSIPSLQTKIIAFDSYVRYDI